MNGPNGCAAGPGTTCAGTPGRASIDDFIARNFSRTA
ncbi:hypothetical protein ISN39_20390 [Rhizobium sp. 007]|nr:hypothetical protein ISN39_20390 [Rhizobium sp. 007]